MLIAIGKQKSQINIMSWNEFFNENIYVNILIGIVKSINYLNESITG